MSTAEYTILVFVCFIAATVVIGSFLEWRHRLTLGWMIPDRTCFLVSDRSWPLVLGLVPVAFRSRPILGCWYPSKVLWHLLWLIGIRTRVFLSIKRNPLLVYHQESDGAIDADSVLYFMQQYKPTRVFYAGARSSELEALLVSPAPHGAGLSEDQVFTMEEGDIPGFWDSFRSAVVVERSDYRSAQMASVFASLKSIPVFFVNESHFGSSSAWLDGKTIYTVGELPPSIKQWLDQHCSRVGYSVDQLVDEYINLTGTQKLLVTNPGDLDIHIDSLYQPDKSGSEVGELFGKDSLVAPILAAGRQEVIVFTQASNQAYEDYDQLVKEMVSSGRIDARFLTIIGSPAAIPQSIELDQPTAFGFRLEYDGRRYGNVLQDPRYVDLATGRIFGLTVSDTSANIARSLFHGSLPRNRDALILPREDRQSGITYPYNDPTELETYYRNNYWTSDVESEFDNTSFYAGHQGVQDNYNDIQDLYASVGLILFVDHGHFDRFAYVMTSDDFINDQIYLTCPTVIDGACSTGAYDMVSDEDKPKLFHVQSIRRGVVAQIAAVCPAYWHRYFGELLSVMYLEGKSVGEAFRVAKNADHDRYVNNFCTGVINGDPYYFLMGDPAFHPKYW